MFEVLSKKTGSMVKVYSATEEKKTGYVKFLVYEDNGWRWRSAKHYKPLDADEVAKLECTDTCDTYGDNRCCKTCEDKCLHECDDINYDNCSKMIHNK